jgi:hypothetical protein
MSGSLVNLSRHQTSPRPVESCVTKILNPVFGGRSERRSRRFVDVYCATESNIVRAYQQLYGLFISGPRIAHVIQFDSQILREQKSLCHWGSASLLLLVFFGF